MDAVDHEDRIMSREQKVMAIDANRKLQSMGVPARIEYDDRGATLQAYVHEGPQRRPLRDQDVGYAEARRALLAVSDHRWYERGEAQ